MANLLRCSTTASCIGLGVFLSLSSSCFRPVADKRDGGGGGCREPGGEIKAKLKTLLANMVCLPGVCMSVFIQHWWITGLRQA